MYSLTIAVGNTVWALMFKTKESADEAHATVRTGMSSRTTTDHFTAPRCLMLDDDFGQNALLVYDSIHGFVLEDLSVSKQAHVERSLHQARTTIEAQEAWKKEPLARAGMHGPSVLTPGMMGANGRFPQ